MALRDFNRTMMLPMRVWDLPTRLFHWIVVLLVAVSYISVEAGWMQVHLLSGYLMLALLLFRLAWGFVGSDTARFRSFLTTPAKALLHLRGFTERTPDTQIGHNAAGGWMVLVMLGLLAVQVLSGLFNTEEYGADYAAAGPLAAHVGEGVANAAGAIHELVFYLLLLLICLHVLAILAYRFVKRHDLVRPMITGVKRLPAATRQPRMANPALAAVILVVALAIAWTVATQI